MSRLNVAVTLEVELPELTEEAISLEGLKNEEGRGRDLFILLTDTGTVFSKVAKVVTKQPYNHVSLAFDESLETLWTYCITNRNGLQGGLETETLKDLSGSRFSLYAITVTEEIYQSVKDKVETMAKDIPGTGYNHLGLLNAIFQREIFNNESTSRLFCSQFVVEILKTSGVELFKKKSSLIRPYDFAKSKLMRFVRRGTLR